MDVRTKRAYEESAEADGRRVLVDRIWPRGVSKKDARLDAWLRQVAPSDELRKWFDHDPERWQEFERRYFAELEDREEAIERLREWAGSGRLTLVYGARDTEHNNAVALREYLMRDEEGSD